MPPGASRNALPGIRYFLDYDRVDQRGYGAGHARRATIIRPHILLLDRTLHVVRRFAIDDAAAAITALRPATWLIAPQDWAPVLIVPNLLEPALCQRADRRLRAHGGEDSGFMREVDGKTVAVTDDQLQAPPRLRDRRRRAARRRCVARIQRRLVPEIKRRFQFEATRIERYIVACYDADDAAAISARTATTPPRAPRTAASR